MLSGYARWCNQREQLGLGFQSFYGKVWMWLAWSHNMIYNYNDVQWLFIVLSSSGTCTLLFRAQGPNSVFCNCKWDQSTTDFGWKADISEWVWVCVSVKNRSLFDLICRLGHLCAGHNMTLHSWMSPRAVWCLMTWMQQDAARLQRNRGVRGRASPYVGSLLYGSWTCSMFLSSHQQLVCLTRQVGSEGAHQAWAIQVSNFLFFRYHGHPSHRKVRCRKCVRRSISSIYMRKVLPFAQQNRLHKCLQRSNLLQRHIFMSSYTVYIYTIACILFCFQRVSLGKCNDTGCWAVLIYVSSVQVLFVAVCLQLVRRSCFSL